MKAMNAVLIALFVSASAHGLPAAPGASGAAAATGIDSPAAPVRKLAGKAKPLTAQVDPETVPAAGDLKLKAVHNPGARKPVFAIAPAPRSIV